jgi:hypothetical protein
MEQCKLKKLFRFFPPEASDFFASKKLWFSSFTDFNDPFEMMPNFENHVQTRIEEAAKKEFAFQDPSRKISWLEFLRRYKEEIVKLDREYIDCGPEVFKKKWSELFGVTCFVGNPEGLKNQLMWGHYTKGHSGFVVEFNPNHKLFQNDKPELFRKVEYPPQRPDYKLGFEKVATLKGEEWKIEEEYRLIKAVTNLQPGQRVWNDGTIKKQWYLDLPTDSVLRIYFGCRMLDSKRDEMIRTLEAAEWGKVEPFVMRIHRTDYRIEPIPLKDWKPVSKKVKERIEKEWDTSLAKYVSESELQWIQNGR